MLDHVGEKRTDRPPREGAVARIMAAAEQVFARSGFQGATTAAIATAAGMPKANLHYYFRTKEALYIAVLEDILALWLDDAHDWIVPGRHPRDALEGYIRAKMMHSRRRPQASRIFAGEVMAGAPRIMPFLVLHLRRHVETLSAVITGWSEAGLMDHVAPAHLLFNIWAMTQTYADFDVQIRAVLGRTEIDAAEHETACATVVALVLKGCGVEMKR